VPTNFEFPLPEIMVGDRDRSLIEWILEEIPQRERFPIAVMLDQELARARIIPASEVPASVVTLGSHFLYREHETGIMRAGTLTIAGVLPGFACHGESSISILTLLGVALLGLGEGQLINLHAPEGRICMVSVLKVLAQPRRR
jgi:regulator of nucleoside diphosphate kinase